jgi:hypothetical protein
VFRRLDQIHRLPAVVIAATHLHESASVDKSSWVIDVCSTASRLAQIFPAPLKLEYSHRKSLIFYYPLVSSSLSFYLSSNLFVFGGRSLVSLAETLEIATKKVYKEDASIYAVEINNEMSYSNKTGFYLSALLLQCYLCHML